MQHLSMQISWGCAFLCRVLIPATKRMVPEHLSRTGRQIVILKGSAPSTILLFSFGVLHNVVSHDHVVETLSGGVLTYMCSRWCCQACLLVSVPDHFIAHFGKKIVWSMANSIFMQKNRSLIMCTSVKCHCRPTAHTIVIPSLL